MANENENACEKAIQEDCLPGGASNVSQMQAEQDRSSNVHCIGRHATNNGLGNYAYILHYILGKKIETIIFTHVPDK